MPSISLFIVLVMVHVSAPYSKILSTVERKEFIFSVRGRLDFHVLSSFLLLSKLVLLCKFGSTNR